MASLTWLGHAAFLLESDAGKRIYVDPWLTGTRRPPQAPTNPERVDVIALTHGHSDHVGDTVALSQAFPEAQVVCQVELKGWLGAKGATSRPAARAQQGRLAGASTASASRSSTPSTRRARTRASTWARPAASSCGSSRGGWSTSPATPASSATCA